MQIVGIVGNLKKLSFNRMLLETCIELAPAGMTLAEERIEGIPLFNEDDRHMGDPEMVVRLKSILAEADGVMMFTPEYNAGIPGVLKNTIDWLSGAPHVLRGKPMGVLGASTGFLGTARAQAQLRISLEHCGAPVMPQPQVFVGRARDQFDGEGRLIDLRTRAFIADYLQKFVIWVERNHAP
jgi:chromate reductase